MTNRARLALAAVFLHSGTLAAQETLDPARAAAHRDAESFTRCLMSRDEDCLGKVAFSEPNLVAESLSRDMDALASQGLSSSPPQMTWSILDYTWMEVAEPWAPLDIDGALYAFVPYFATYGDAVRGDRKDRMAYLIGTSADGGATWRFFAIRHDLSSADIDRAIPGLGEAPRPKVRDVAVRESRFERSRWLETLERRIVPVGEAYVYVLAFGIREEIDGPIGITVRYDNPADRNRPLSIRGSLEPGQAELRWQSPPIEGFEAGQTYLVAIEGSNPDTGELLFEHREELLLDETRELWLTVMSRPPTPNPSSATGR